jgi:hypothetical protein
VEDFSPILTGVKIPVLDVQCRLHESNLQRNRVGEIKTICALSWRQNLCVSGVAFCHSSPNFITILISVAELKHVCFSFYIIFPQTAVQYLKVSCTTRFNTENIYSIPIHVLRGSQNKVRPFLQP